MKRAPRLAQERRYTVYRQRIPLRTLASDGEEIWRANLRAVGVVLARTADEALARAKAQGLAAAPVIEPERQGARP